MNKPITLCDRCKEYARCCLNYDGDNCRRSRTVEPTNADRIRSMTDEELVNLLTCIDMFCCPVKGIDCFNEPSCEDCFAKWLKQEADT